MFHRKADTVVEIDTAVYRLMKEVAADTERGERFTISSLLESHPDLRQYGREMREYLQPAGRIGLRRAYQLKDEHAHLQEEPISDYIDITLLEPSQEDHIDVTRLEPVIEVVSVTETGPTRDLPPVPPEGPHAEPATAPDSGPIDTPSVPSEGYNWKRPLDEIENPVLSALARVYRAGLELTSADLINLDPDVFGSHGKTVRARTSPYLRATGDKRNSRDVLELRPDVVAYLQCSEGLPEPADDGIDVRHGMHRENVERSPEFTDDLLETLYSGVGGAEFTVSDARGVLPVLKTCHGPSIASALRRAGCHVTGERDLGYGNPVGVYRFGDAFLEKHGAAPTDGPTDLADASRHAKRPHARKEEPPPGPDELERMRTELEKLLPDVLDYLGPLNGEARRPEEIFSVIGEGGKGIDLTRLDRLLTYASENSDIVSSALGDGCRLERITSQDGSVRTYCINIVPEILRDPDSINAVAMEVADALRRGPRSLENIYRSRPDLGVSEDDFGVVVRYLLDEPEEMRAAAGKALMISERYGYYLEGTDLSGLGVRAGKIQTIGDLLAAGFAGRPETMMEISVGGPPDGLLERKARPDLRKYIALLGGVDVTAANCYEILGSDGLVLVSEDGNAIMLELYAASEHGVKRTRVHTNGATVHASCATVSLDDNSLLASIRRAGRVVSIHAEALAHFDALGTELFGDLHYASALPAEGWRMLLGNAMKQHVIYAAVHLSDGSPENIDAVARHMDDRIDDCGGLLQILVKEEKVYAKSGRFSPWKDDKVSSNTIHLQGQRSIVSEEFASLACSLDVIHKGCKEAKTKGRLAIGYYPEKAGTEGDLIRIFGTAGDEAFMVFGTVSHRTPRPDNFQVLENGVRISRPLPKQEVLSLQTPRMSVDELRILLQTLHWKGSFKVREDAD